MQKSKVIVIDDNEVRDQLYPQTLIRSSLKKVPAVKLATKSIKQLPKTIRYRSTQECARRCQQNYLFYCGNPVLYAQNAIANVVKTPRLTRNFDNLFVCNPFCGNIHDRAETGHTFLQHCSLVVKMVRAILNLLKNVIQQQ